MPFLPSFLQSSGNLLTAVLVVLAVAMAVLALSFHAEATPAKTSGQPLQGDMYLGTEPVDDNEPVDVIAIYNSAPVVGLQDLHTASTNHRESDRMTLAPAHIVFFFDHRCPHSNASMKAVTQIQGLYPEETSIQLEPLPMNDSGSDLASLALVCAGNQGMTTQMHTALSATNRPVTRSLLNKVVPNLSPIPGPGERFDREAFLTCLDAPSTTRELQMQIEAARKLGVQGVPAFLINDRLIHGALDADQLDQLVRHVLSQTSTDIALAH